MSAVQTKILEDLRVAMKNRDDVRLRTLRLVTTDIQKLEKSGQSEALTDDQILKILQRQSKQRTEARERYIEAGRAELAEREAEELAILAEYLPTQMSDEELADAVAAVIDQLGASSMKDMGRVMGAAMQQLQGKADGKRVQQQVSSFLKQ